VNQTWLVREIRRPASAALAGIFFGVTLGVVILLLQSASPDLATDPATWIEVTARRDAVELALGVIPFAGIAFLWFIAVIRAQLGSREDRFFETVFLGSGLLFVAMLFASAAALKGALILVVSGAPVPATTLAYAWALATSLLGSFGARMVAVFMLSVTTMGARTGTVPRWLAVPGYVIALLLLLTPPLPSLSQFLFPLWVIALSLYILLGRRSEEST
jgi:hypothetical protein